MATLATRTISGKGLLRLDKTSNDFKKAKIIAVYADILRYPRNRSINLGWNPPRGRLATLNFMFEGYVIKSEPMDFDSQAWNFYPELGYQGTYELQCAYEGILGSFVNLGLALGLTPIAITDRIKDFKHVDLFWDEIRCVCYADTAVILTVTSIPYDLCPDQSDKEPSPPPPSPPPPPPVVPPGSPLGNGTNPPVSPPYDGTNDGGDTVPFPDDTDTPPIPPPSGQRVNVVILWYINDDATNGRTSNIVVWGDATAVRSTAIGGMGHLQIFCYGAAPTTGGTPDEVPLWVDVLPPDGNPNRYGNVNQPSIVSITPV